MTAPLIGIYAHHHGSGHLHRCREIARCLRTLGYEVKIFSSAPGADVVLPDDAPKPGREPSWQEISASGTAHYAPHHNRGLQQRFAILAQWIARHRPAAFYVDVSAEVVNFIRLMGVPVATIAMPGVRDDYPHQVAYRQADAILAAWPSWVELPFHLTPHVDRVHAVGGISRLRTPEILAHYPRRVIVMAGEGGSTWDSNDWSAVEQACPEWEFVHLSGAQRVDDPSEYLSSAAVAVIAGGQNSVADVATMGTPAIVLPQPRPFAEQFATAKILADAGLAIVVDQFPTSDSWPALLEQALASDTEWQRWETTGAAQRAAEVIAGIACANAGIEAPELVPAQSGSTAETTELFSTERSEAERVAVITLTNLGRVGHVQNQIGLLPLGVDHITVALADAELIQRALPGSTVVAAPCDDLETHLAAARNFGARVAIERGARTLIFLDADCVASNQLIGHYLQALGKKPGAVVAGPVTYMKQGELRTSDPRPHAARPNPAAGELVLADNYDLFWSLSFALTDETWNDIQQSFGGFDERFTGYGGEDTDFAANLKKHGFQLWWVGGAHAFHQWHPVSSPPWEHLDDILRNARYFHEKWNRWPMDGWLQAFAEEGAVEFAEGTWRRVRT